MTILSRPRMLPFLSPKIILIRVMINWTSAMRACNEKFCFAWNPIILITLVVTDPAAKSTDFTILLKIL